MKTKPEFSREPDDTKAFTSSVNRWYSKFARPYDLAVKILPFWKRWLEQTIPHLRGPRLLEVSFGTGYLLTQVAGSLDAYGLDYNRTMVATARKNLDRAGLHADLVQGNVEALPYPAESFDSLVSTMAFTGFPDGRQALAEMSRVLKPDGVLILVDVNYPHDGNWAGSLLTELSKRSGDIVRDMGALFRQANLDYTDEEIGALGSIHLYRAVKAVE